MANLTAVAVGAVAVVAVAGAAIAVTSVGGKYNEDHTADCVVNNKYVSTKTENGNTTSEKRVETSCGVFTVEDSFFKGKHRSADTYALLQNGHKYTLTYNGVRSGWMSSFPNITSAVEIK